MLGIGIIAAVIYLYTATKKQRTVALNKGVDEEDLSLFSVYLWLYALPPVAMLFVQQYSLVIALLFITLYIPGIVGSSKVATKLASGYDYERKAGREFSKAMWLGYAGIGLVILSWLLASARELLQR